MPLDRDQVVQAAVELADAHGIAALSMRKLGEALGVEAMSLYNHVANKGDLVDGMVDAVFAEIGSPAAGDPWREAMARRAAAAREVLGRHPWALALLESRTSPGAATLRHHDAVLGCLRASGFTVAEAAHAYALLDSYTYGFALQEAMLPFAPGEETVELTGSILASMPEGELPHLAELAREHVLRPGYDFGDEFSVGLGIVLDGLARMVDGAPAGSASRPRPGRSRRGAG